MALVAKLTNLVSYEQLRVNEEAATGLLSPATTFCNGIYDLVNGFGIEKVELRTTDVKHKEPLPFYGVM